MAYYYNHPDLNLPEDNTIIWRYMDLRRAFQAGYNKFIQALAFESCFFGDFCVQTRRHPKGKFSAVSPLGLAPQLGTKIKIIVHGSLELFAKVVGVFRLKSDGITNIDYFAKKYLRFFIKLDNANIPLIFHLFPPPWAPYRAESGPHAQISQRP